MLDQTRQSFRKQFRATQTFLTAICVLISSCSGNPPVSDRVDIPLPEYSSIAIITPEDIVALKGVKPRGTKAVEGAVTGAALGGTGGALWGTWLCFGMGPWWGLCAATLGAAGLVAGAVGGATIGFEGVSKEDSLYITEELTHLRQQRNFQQEFAQGVIERLPPEILVKPEEASAQAITKIAAVDFIAKNKNAAYIKVRAALVVIAKDEHGNLSEVRRNVVAFSDRYPIEKWLERGSGKFEASADQCMEQLVSKTTTLLLEHQMTTVGEAK